MGEEDEFNDLISIDLKGKKEKEIEERNWRNDLIMENFLRKTKKWWNTVEDFDLSKVIMRLMPTGTRMVIPAVPLSVSPTRNKFSWRNPVWAGVSLYRNGGDVALNMPKVLSQGKTPFCLAYSMYHSMCIQCAILSEYHDINPPRPRPSLNHLIYLLSPFTFKTFESYTLALLKNGIYKHLAFPTKITPNSSMYFKFARPKPGAVPFFQFSDPEVIFARDYLTETQFAIQIAYAIGKFGSVVLHVRCQKPDYPYILVPLRNRPLQSVSNKVDHAVCCFAWTIKAGRFAFHCADSAGGELKTIERINYIMAVLIFQIRDFTQHKKKNTGGSQYYEHGESSRPGGHDQQAEEEEGKQVRKFDYLHSL